MPDLLLELFSEEIPARMQAKAADDLRRIVADKLVDAGLVYESAKAFATPRRLTLVVEGIPARQPDLKEEKKGPRVGAPDGAIQGFLKSAGIASLDEAKIQKDPKKGDFYIALIEKPGRPAIEVLADILPGVVRSFPWPKQMRWGDGRLTWVRPLHSIVATFGPANEQPEIVPFSVDGIKAGTTTRGHRFLSPAPFEVRHFDDYVQGLDKAKVVLDPARRRDIILHDAKQLAFAQGLDLVEDAGLLDEVAGLVEWPVVLMGSFDAAFLKIPDEVIRTTIRANQKCFVLRDPQTARLANKFIMVANTEAVDGGKAIVAGNERVIRARLSDAKFFYDTDLKTRLEDRLPKFEGIVFHEKLGRQSQHIERIEILAAQIAPLVDADVEKVRRAARLCKADLLTEVVGEFPELHGLMGKYYAEAQGEDEAVAHACEDHWKPEGLADLVPAEPVSIAVALADKIDMLMSFWLINEKPTGSKDPFALRRAALGVIRIILDNELRLPLMKVLITAHISVSDDLKHMELDRKAALLKKLRDLDVPFGSASSILKALEEKAFPEKPSKDQIDVAFDEIFNLRLYLDDRLEGQLRDQGARYDLAKAVFELANEDDLLLIVRRIEALAKFLDTEDGKNLLAGTKRAANILRIEEKKDGKSYDTAPDPALYQQDEEKALASAIAVARTEASAAVAREDFASAMTAMAKLRHPVDAFFDKVTVNAEDAAVRANRLRLLNEIRQTTRGVADFSRIEG